MDQPPRPPDPLLTTHFDSLFETLKVHWTILDFESRLKSVPTSPCFRSPSDPENKFCLQLTTAVTDVSDVSDWPPPQISVTCLHILRKSSSSREIGIKYLIGLGGPNGTMKLLTQDGLFKKHKVTFGGTLVQTSKITNPAASYLMPDGSLKVYAEIRVLKAAATGVKDGVRDRVFDLMNEKIFTDMTIESGGVYLPAHRLLVAASSPLLLEQLKQQEKDGLEQRLKLDEDLEQVTCWINFSYSGRLPALSHDQSLLMLPFAVRNQIPSLYDAISTNLTENLTIENVVKTTRSAHMHNCSQLLDRCLNFIGKHVQEVENWSELFDDATSRDLFHLILKVLKKD